MHEHAAVLMRRLAHLQLTRCFQAQLWHATPCTSARPVSTWVQASLSLGCTTQTCFRRTGSNPGPNMAAVLYICSLSCMRLRRPAVPAGALPVPRCHCAGGGQHPDWACAPQPTTQLQVGLHLTLQVTSLSWIPSTVSQGMRVGATAPAHFLACHAVCKSCWVVTKAHT